MPRLIDADALGIGRAKPEAFIKPEYAYGWNSAIDAIEAAPTIAPESMRPHGRWVRNGTCNHKPARFKNPDLWAVYKCSECGYSNGRRWKDKYCPNCGAKMDEEEDDGQG